MVGEKQLNKKHLHQQPQGLWENPYVIRGVMYKMSHFCHIDFALLKRTRKIALQLDNLYKLVVTLTSIQLKVILECQFKQHLGEHSRLHAINEEASFYDISLQDNDMEQHIYRDYTFGNFQWL